MENEFLTVKEVAEILRVHKMTVWRYVQNGVLPAFKLGKGLRILKSDLLEFLRKREVKK